MWGRGFRVILQNVSEKPENELHNESIEINKTEKEIKILKIDTLKLKTDSNVTGKKCQIRNCRKYRETSFYSQLLGNFAITKRKWHQSERKIV